MVRLLVCCAAFVALHCTPCVVHAQPVKLVVGEWAPYVSADLDGYGPAVALVRRAFALVGESVEIEFYPWTRCESMVEQGAAFATFPYVATEARTRFARFVGPLFISEQRFFFRKSRVPEFVYSDDDSLQGYSIAGTTGYAFVEVLNARGFALDISPHEESAFRKLIAGRVDLTVAETRTGWHLLHQLAPDDATSYSASVRPFLVSTYWLMVSDKYPDAAFLTGQFEKGLAMLRASGEYDAILGMSDVQE